MRLLLIDNYDSFTYNLYQQIAAMGPTVIVRKNDEIGTREFERGKFDRIVISPGPGSPSESGVSMEVIRSFAPKLPILGVCLGHQCIAEVFGGTIVQRAVKVMHGKTSEIFHDGEGLMRGLPSPFTAARYHSLIVSAVPAHFQLTCWTGTQRKPDLIMGIAHETLPIFGVQFHPESFLTEHGDRIVRNFLKLT